MPEQPQKPFAWVDEVEAQMRRELVGPAAEARPAANVSGEQTAGYAAVPQPVDLKSAARVLESIARQECPHCASRQLIEIGRSVYCDACGARLYLGKLFTPMGPA